MYVNSINVCEEQADRTTQQVLRKESAWDTLDLETRQRLYALLPAPADGEPPHDPNVNPLETQLGKAIEDELRKWQDGLKEGREGKKWREDAMLAGRDRTSGKFDVQQTGGRESESGEDGKTT